MNKKRIIKWSIFLIILIGLVYWVFSSYNAPGKYDNLAKCMTEKGMVMYGTDWCPHCINQKALFGKSFKLITYKNCDYNKVVCDLNNVTGYPTWISPEKRFEGEQTIEALASATGCEIDPQ